MLFFVGQFARSFLVGRIVIRCKFGKRGLCGILVGALRAEMVWEYEFNEVANFLV